ncbi:MAG: regulatory protein GemA [Desulfocapsaceae bacterium]|nr:regulatory protein GemA [Desulfocapsaceae bacterium]
MAPSRAALAKIHIAKKELGLSEDAYLDILSMHFQVASAAKLTDRQATVLINSFKAKGWKERLSQKKVASPKYENAQMRKVVAIWINLRKAGVVHDSSDKALQAYVKRMSGVDNLLWCNNLQLDTIIESLKRWAYRKGVELD